MFIRVCKKEICPHCSQISCDCEQVIIDTSIGWKLVCPFCKGIMSSCTVTTSETIQTIRLASDMTQCLNELNYSKIGNSPIKQRFK